MRLLAVTIAFLVLSSSVFAQAKNDSKITVAPTDTAKLFDKLITLIYSENYIVHTEDRSHGIIITEPKTLQTYLNPQVRLKLAIAGTVTVTGEVNSNITQHAGGVTINPTFEPITNKGMKNSVYRSAWNEMDRVAKLVGAVTYGK